MYFNCAASTSDSNTRSDDNNLSDVDSDNDYDAKPADRTCRLSKYKHTAEETSRSTRVVGSIHCVCKCRSKCSRKILGGVSPETGEVDVYSSS